MQRTSQDSPSITVSPPVEGAIIADVDSVKSPVLSGTWCCNGNGCYIGPSDFYFRSCEAPSSPRGFIMCASSVLRSQTRLRPVRLMTIAHAFNYRVAVLRDGARSAIRIGRPSKAETCFLTEANIAWGQQVTAMFQIVSTMMVEVPAFAGLMRELKGESPNIQPYSEPWGHVSHCDTNCTCLSSDRTASYYMDWFLCHGKMTQQQRRTIEP